MVLNPGALAHQSYALRDAVEACSAPVIEVHMSNIAARESWRAHSIISPAVKGTVQGLGPVSYLAALRGLVEMLRESEAAA